MNSPLALSEVEYDHNYTEQSMATSTNRNVINAESLFEDNSIKEITYQNKKQAVLYFILISFSISLLQFGGSQSLQLYSSLSYLINVYDNSNQETNEKMAMTSFDTDVNRKGFQDIVFLSQYVSAYIFLFIYFIVSYRLKKMIIFHIPRIFFLFSLGQVISSFFWLNVYLQDEGIINISVDSLYFKVQLGFYGILNSFNISFAYLFMYIYLHRQTRLSSKDQDLQMLKNLVIIFFCINYIFSGQYFGEALFRYFVSYGSNYMRKLKIQLYIQKKFQNIFKYLQNYQFLITVSNVSFGVILFGSFLAFFVPQNLLNTKRGNKEIQKTFQAFFSQIIDENTSTTQTDSFWKILKIQNTKKTVFFYTVSQINQDIVEQVLYNFIYQANDKPSNYSTTEINRFYECIFTYYGFKVLAFLSMGPLFKLIIQRNKKKIDKNILNLGLGILSILVVILIVSQIYIVQADSHPNTIGLFAYSTCTGYLLGIVEFLALVYLVKFNEPVFNTFVMAQMNAILITCLIYIIGMNLKPNDDYDIAFVIEQIISIIMIVFLYYLNLKEKHITTDEEIINENRLEIIRGTIDEEQIDKFQFKARYEYVGKLGQGSQGIVSKYIGICIYRYFFYFQQDRLYNKTVAVKIMVTQNCDQYLSHQQELQHIKQLNKYRAGVIPIDQYVLSEEDQHTFQIFLILEYADGNLFEEIENHQNTQTYFTNEEIEQLMIQTINTLYLLQKEQNFAHRDVKPSNIVFLNDPKTKIRKWKFVDLGVSKFVSLRNQQDEVQLTIVGTPGYISPQMKYNFQLKQAVSERTSFLNVDLFKNDVFSLGLTFLRATTLKPVTNLNISELELQFRLQELKQLQIYSEQVIKIIELMLTWNEDQRPDFVELIRLIR